MKVFFAGVIVGIIIATVGVTGLFRIFDNGVHDIKEISREFAK